MHRGLGEPLPHQLANAPRVHPSATPESAFQIKTMRFRLLYGISTCFQVLSPSDGQVTHVLLTRSPLFFFRWSKLRWKSVRLACIRHAASVRPEPGSNSHKSSKNLTIVKLNLFASILLAC